jgi:hypothetical protein
MTLTKASSTIRPGYRPASYDLQAASDAISRRDADERTATLTTPQEAAQLLRQARRNRDSILIHSITSRASDAGWNLTD